MPDVRPLHVIASDISTNWPKVNYAANPWLHAMGCLDEVTDQYHQDSGKTVVMYFLSNAGSWRGEHAKRIKAELKALIK